MSRLRLGKPGLPDLVFGIVLVTVLIGGRTGFLNDPGTFWHVRLGREIARTGTVPRFDTLTYTRDQVPWVDQSWAFDWLLAGVVDHWGWSAAIGLTALGLAFLYTALSRTLLDDGISPLIALVVPILAAGIGTIHFLMRPHLLTFGFFAAFLWICRRQHERGGWVVWWLPVLMIPWANVHGGFLAGPVIVATAALGHALSGRWEAARRREVATFGVVCVLSCLTPLINPYGFGLYRHVAGLLVSSGVTTLIMEYQPIPFGKGEARVVEWVVLGLIALPCFSARRPSRYDLAHALVWLHLALASVRHVPLFALAVAPVLAALLDGLPMGAREPIAARVGWSPWPFAIALALALALGMGVPFGGFDTKNWPLSAVATLNREPVSARLFHEQDWGGLIEAECRPTRRTFVDDRFELFGKKAILEYADALQGGPEWDALFEREQFALVWLRPDRSLARRLAADPRWRVLHRDAVSVLYRREPAGPAVVAGPTPVGSSG